MGKELKILEYKTDPPPKIRDTPSLQAGHVSPLNENLALIGPIGAEE
jgi:hypothetical protein